MRLYYIQVDIFEEGGNYPVVQHTFYGRTKDEAQGYHEAHMQTDSFLRGCEGRGRWQDIRCNVRVTEGWRSVR